MCSSLYMNFSGTGILTLFLPTIVTQSILQKNNDSRYTRGFTINGYDGLVFQELPDIDCSPFKGRNLSNTKVLVSEKRTWTHC